MTMNKDPYLELMAAAEHERTVSDSAEGEALRDAVCEAVRAYSDFLDRHGLVWVFDSDWPRLKARALVITLDYGEGMGGIEFVLKDGAVDRVYGDGRNPDPEGRGPPDTPHVLGAGGSEDSLH
jgi:hypothetical protein